MTQQRHLARNSNKPPSPHNSSATSLSTSPPIHQNIDNKMSANVGLSTPRGSGTSGYVQKNMSLLRQHNRDRGGAYPTDPDDFRKHQQRQPDPEILEHDRKRRIENKVFELRDRLEDEE